MDDFDDPLLFDDIASSFWNVMRAMKTSLSGEIGVFFRAVDSLVSDSVTAVGGVHPLGVPPMDYGPSSDQKIFFCAGSYCVGYIDVIMVLSTLSIVMTASLLYVRWKKGNHAKMILNEEQRQAKQASAYLSEQLGMLKEVDYTEREQTLAGSYCTEQTQGSYCTEQTYSNDDSPQTKYSTEEGGCTPPSISTPLRWISKPNRHSSPTRKIRKTRKIKDAIVRSRLPSLDKVTSRRIHQTTQPFIIDSGQGERVITEKRIVTKKKDKPKRVKCNSRIFNSQTETDGINDWKSFFDNFGRKHPKMNRRNSPLRKESTDLRSDGDTAAKKRNDIKATIVHGRNPDARKIPPANVHQLNKVWPVDSPKVKEEITSKLRKTVTPEMNSFKGQGAFLTYKRSALDHGDKVIIENSQDEPAFDVSKDSFFGTPINTTERKCGEFNNTANNNPKGIKPLRNYQHLRKYKVISYPDAFQQIHQVNNDVPWNQHDTENEYSHRDKRNSPSSQETCPMIDATKLGKHYMQNANSNTGGDSERQCPPTEKMSRENDPIIDRAKEQKSRVSKVMTGKYKVCRICKETLKEQRAFIKRVGKFREKVSEDPVHQLKSQRKETSQQRIGTDSLVLTDNSHNIGSHSKTEQDVAKMPSPTITLTDTYQTNQSVNPDATRKGNTVESTTKADKRSTRINLKWKRGRRHRYTPYSSSAEGSESSLVWQGDSQEKSFRPNHANRYREKDRNNCSPSGTGRYVLRIAKEFRDNLDKLDNAYQNTSNDLPGYDVRDPDEANRICQHDLNASPDQQQFNPRHVPIPNYEFVTIGKGRSETFPFPIETSHGYVNVKKASEEFNRMHSLATKENNYASMRAARDAFLQKACQSTAQKERDDTFVKQVTGTTANKPYCGKEQHTSKFDIDAMKNTDGSSSLTNERNKNTILSRGLDNTSFREYTSVKEKRAYFMSPMEPSPCPHSTSSTVCAGPKPNQENKVNFPQGKPPLQENCAPTVQTTSPVYRFNSSRLDEKKNTSTASAFQPDIPKVWPTPSVPEEESSQERIIPCSFLPTPYRQSQKQVHSVRALSPLTTPELPANKPSASNLVFEERKTPSPTPASEQVPFQEYKKDKTDESTIVSVAVQTSPFFRPSCRQLERFRQRKSLSIIPRLQRDRAIYQKAFRSCQRHTRYRQLSREMTFPKPFFQSNTLEPVSTTASINPTQKTPCTDTEKHTHSGQEAPHESESVGCSSRSVEVQVKSEEVSSSATLKPGEITIKNDSDDSQNDVKGIVNEKTANEAETKGSETLELGHNNFLTKPADHGEYRTSIVSETLADPTQEDKQLCSSGFDVSDSSVSPSRLSNLQCFARPMWQNANVEELNRRVEKALRLREQLRQWKHSRREQSEDSLRPEDKTQDPLDKSNTDNAGNMPAQLHERDIISPYEALTVSQQIENTIQPTKPLGNNTIVTVPEKTVKDYDKTLPSTVHEGIRKNTGHDVTETAEGSLTGHAKLQSEGGQKQNKHRPIACGYANVTSKETHVDNVSGRSGGSKRSGEDHNNSPPTKISKVENTPNQSKLVGDIVQSLPQVPLSSFVEWFIETSDPNNFAQTDQSSSTSDKREERPTVKVGHEQLCLDPKARKVQGHRPKGQRLKSPEWRSFRSRPSSLSQGKVQVTAVNNWTDLGTSNQQRQKGHVGKTSPVQKGHIGKTSPVQKGHVGKTSPVQKGHVGKTSPVQKGHIGKTSPVQKGHIGKTSPVQQGHVGKTSSVQLGHIGKTSPVQKGHIGKTSPVQQGHFGKTSPVQQGHNVKTSPVQKGNSEKASSVQKGQIYKNSPLRKQDPRKLHLRTPVTSKQRLKQGGSKKTSPGSRKRHAGSKNDSNQSRIMSQRSITDFQSDTTRNTSDKMADFTKSSFISSSIDNVAAPVTNSTSSSAETSFQENDKTFMIKRSSPVFRLAETNLQPGSSKPVETISPNASTNVCSGEKDFTTSPNAPVNKNDASGLRHLLMKLNKVGDVEETLMQKKKTRITLRRSSEVTGIMAKFQKRPADQGNS